MVKKCTTKISTEKCEISLSTKNPKFPNILTKIEIFELFWYFAKYFRKRISNIFENLKFSNLAQSYGDVDFLVVSKSRKNRNLAKYRKLKISNLLTKIEFFELFSFFPKYFRERISNIFENLKKSVLAQSYADVNFSVLVGTHFWGQKTWFLDFAQV